MLVLGIEGVGRGSPARQMRERTSGHCDYPVQGEGAQPAKHLLQLQGV